MCKMVKATYLIQEITGRIATNCGCKGEYELAIDTLQREFKADNSDFTINLENNCKVHHPHDMPIYATGTARNGNKGFIPFDIEVRPSFTDKACIIVRYNLEGIKIGRKRMDAIVIATYNALEKFFNRELDADAFNFSYGV